MPKMIQDQDRVGGWYLALSSPCRHGEVSLSVPSAGDMVGGGKGCATKVSRTNYAAGLVPVRSAPQVAWPAHRGGRAWTTASGNRFAVKLRNGQSDHHSQHDAALLVTDTSLSLISGV